MIALHRIVFVSALVASSSLASAQDGSDPPAAEPTISAELETLLAELAEFQREASASDGETREVIDDQADEKRAEVFALIDKTKDLGEAKAKAVALSKTESKRLRRLIKTAATAAGNRSPGRRIDSGRHRHHHRHPDLPQRHWSAAGGHVHLPAARGWRPH